MLGARAANMLRQLDRRLLPPLAARLVRLGRAPVRMPVVAGAAAVSASAVLIVAAWVVGQQPSNAGPAGGHGPVRVGVGDGASITGYVRDSRSELDALLTDRPPGRDGETYALVAFGAYLAPERLAPVLDGASVAAVFARVPVVGADAEAVRIPVAKVPDDVLAGMDRAAADRESSAARLEALSAGLRGGGTQEGRMRTEYRVNAGTARAEAAAYRVHCACLYAAVVKGRPAALSLISQRPEVRAVDPAPEVTRVEEAEFVPPLPEQSVAVPPPTASAPPPLPTPAGIPPPTAATDPTTAPQPQPTDSSGGGVTTERVPTDSPPPSPSDPPGDGGAGTNAGTNAGTDAGADAPTPAE